MKKVTDIIVEFLESKGVKTAFGVPGGAALHLIDSLDRSNKITPIFMHHEQAAAFAAQAYSRVAGVPGVCFVTTGPGGTNAITGLLAAWLDSIPTIFISGQVRSNHLSGPKKIRQYGMQEYDIISLVKNMTKKAVLLKKASDIYRVLEECYETATTGRPGPVWIDIPLELQWEMITNLPFQSNSHLSKTVKNPSPECKMSASNVYELIKKSKRPLIMLGNGVRLADAVEEFYLLNALLDIPVVASWNASDIIDTDKPEFIGRPGVFGQRGANLAVQNCDLLLVLGSHLSIPLTGTQFRAFAREATVIVVDIDRHEVSEMSVHVELPVIEDVGDFMFALRQVLSENSLPSFYEWKNFCKKYKLLNSINPKYPDEGIDPYVFVDSLSEIFNGDEAVVIDGGGTCNQIAFQSLRTKKGQRLIISGGLCSMGSGIPESIGIAFNDLKKQVICFCGDGSFQFNIQELQTIKHHRLNIKIFVFCNSGYLSIRHTQNSFFDGRHIGSSSEGGLSVPDINSIAMAYGIETVQLTSINDLNVIKNAVLSHARPLVCTILIPPNSIVEPTVGFTKTKDGVMVLAPLEDMAPLLDRNELSNLMFVKPYKG